MESKPISTKIKYVDGIYYGKEYGIEAFYLSCSSYITSVFNNLKNIFPNMNLFLCDFSKFTPTKKYTLMEDLQIEKYGKVKSGTIGIPSYDSNIYYFKMINENKDVCKLGIGVEYILLNDELFAPTEN